MPSADRPISELFRISSEEWADADAAANQLEETKSAVLAKMMMAEGDIPVSRAEMRVKASDEWREHIKKMVDARATATRLKVRVDYIKMRFSEWQAADANARVERRIS
jgi:hypothetical protein